MTVRRWIAAAAMVLLLAGGVFAWTRERPGQGAALAAVSAVPAIGTDTAAAPAGNDVPLVAPVSDTTPIDREARRFARYDRDEDGAVSQAEYLANRRKAFERQDVDGDGVLSFAESAARTVTKFVKADVDRDGELEPDEFATTAVKRRARSPRADCPPVRDEGEA